MLRQMARRVKLPTGRSENALRRLCNAASPCGTLPGEQIRNEPSPRGGGFEKMARRRYQKPTPQRRGEQWSVPVREDVVVDGQRTRKVRRVPLGPAALTRAEAERLRDDYLAAVNQANV